MNLDLFQSYFNTNHLDIVKSTTSIRAGMRDSKIQDGEDVDVLRSLDPNQLQYSAKKHSNQYLLNWQLSEMSFVELIYFCQVYILTILGVQGP